MSVSILVTPVVNGISISESSTTITASNVALGSANASSMAVTPVGGLTATNVQAALEALTIASDADIKAFQQNAAPTGSDLTEGDTWYDLDDNEFKVYRETSVGVFQWVPIIVGATGDSSDLLDAGAF